MSPGAQETTRLRCTAFEELMLDQDSELHPCVICVRLDLSGQLDQQLLRQALEQIVATHPLLRARLELSRGKLWWQVYSQGSLSLHVHNTAAPAWPDPRYFNLGQTFGFHADLYQVATSDAMTLFLQVHHAVADGLGCCQIVEDLLQFYCSTDARPPVRQANHLRDRNRFGMGLIAKLRLIPQQLRGWAGVWQFLTRQPVPLKSMMSAHSTDRALAAVHYCYSAEQTQRLKEAAREHQATLNELLASFVFEACHGLLHSQKDYRANQWLRMMVPMSLRDADSATFSACNIVACVFLDRTGRQIVDHAKLLTSIHNEMDLIKRNRLGFLFILSLWIKKIFRFRSRRHALVAAPVKRCQTSVVFSNMGRLFEHTQLPRTSDGRLQAGSVTLETCQILAPVTHLTSVAITAYQYAGRITLSLRYDPGSINESDALALLRAITQGSCATGPGAQSSGAQSNDVATETSSSLTCRTTENMQA